jgi:site-specific DNA-methyltransferase (adenine-specific)/modification methylase
VKKLHVNQFFNDKDSSQLIHGETIQILNQIPNEWANLIFVDPPYNIGVKKPLKRSYRSGDDYKGVSGANWDSFETYKEYENFTISWLDNCQRILNKNGSIFCCGTYHNIYITGYFLRKFDFWIMNEITWLKPNPVPNMMGVRLAQGHETIIWATKTKKSKPTFNYQLLKMMNNRKQMTAEWTISPPSGHEIIRKNNKRIHPSQKPEQLLFRIISGMSNEGDNVLDPFMGTGTTGSICKNLNRNFCGIDNNLEYVEAAKERIIKTKMGIF